MILTDEAGEKAWPIAGATFILFPKQPKDVADASVALNFFAWAYKNGDAMASDLDYVPMPDNVVKIIEQSWTKEIKGADGKAVYSVTN
jgi:phosphate transport system substrate-binding protein